MPILREQDYYGWCLEQQALLAARDSTHLDYDRLAEELSSAAMSDLDELTTRLQHVLTHLLKLHLGREHKPHDFDRAARLADMRRGSNQHSQIWLSSETQAAARLEAAKDLPIAESLVPATCPWTLEDILQVNWFADLAD